MSEKNNLQKLQLLEPRKTEKSYLEQTNRYYVFEVKRGMSKQEVAKMVEGEFKVTVTDVKTLMRKGKKTKFSKGKHAYPGITYRQDKKFAYVRLKKGDSIRVFEDANEAKAEAKKSEKTEKATQKADKNAGKENK